MGVMLFDRSSSVRRPERRRFANLKWLSESLRVGDSISIRIVEVEAADPPVERRRDDPEAVERSRRRYYEQLKREYGQ